MIKLVIFDFDGVLDNNYEFHYELSKKQITGLTREEHRKLFEGNIHVEREKLKHRNTGFDLRTPFSNAKKKKEIEGKTKVVLTKLSKNHILGIVTSAKESGINGFLEKNGIQDLFSFVYGSETDKYKSQKFQKVLDEFNFVADECIFVTDTLGDILEANKIGIKTLAVDFGFHEKERLQKGNPLKIISDINELIPPIKNL